MVTWKIFCGYLLLLLFILVCKTSSGQIVATHFNAEWNNPNKVKFVGDLVDCEIVYVDIAVAPKLQALHKIVVVPTIIIFNGKEVERFQADLTFEITAKLEDIQDVIDEILMEDF